MLNLGTPTGTTSPLSFTSTAPTTANSTPAFTSSASTTPTAPSMTFPVGQGLPAPAPVATAPNTSAMYSPQAGPTTQKLADATYADKITKAASEATTIPSSDISSNVTLPNANAKRSTLETLLESYLNGEKERAQKLAEANTPSAEETAASKRLIALKEQAGLDEETALNSGETSVFAGGEAQRVNRTNNIKIAAANAELERLQNYRKNATDTIQALIDSGDKSFKTQLEIQKLQDEVSNVDKQAQQTFFNIAQAHPDVAYTYDPTKSAVDNFKALQAQVIKSPSYIAEQRRAEKLASSGSGSSTPKTLEERKAVTLQAYQSKLVAGAMYGDTPVFDPNGYMTPKVWNAAISSGEIGREDFIKNFGHLIYTDKNGVPDKQYKLTPKEQALISG
jgi:hypothetical protein